MTVEAEIKQIDIFHRIIMRDYEECSKLAAKTFGTGWDTSNYSKLAEIIRHDKRAFSEIHDYISILKYSGLPQNLQYKAMQTVLVYIAWSARLSMCGNKSFFVRKNLLTSLAHTDPFLDLSDIQFPYESIYVEFDKRAGIRIPAGANGNEYEAVVIGVYISDLKGDIDVMVISTVGDQPEDILPVGISWKIDKNYKYESKYDFSKQLEHVKNYNKEHKNIVIEISSIVTNILLYIDSPKADLEFIETSRRKISTGVGKKNNKRKLIIDGFVIIGDSMEPMAEDSDFDRSGVVPKYKHKVKYMVRGHWRRQPVGPRGGGETIKIRIPPHIRGPADAPYKDSDYKVISTKEDECKSEQS